MTFRKNLNRQVRQQFQNVALPTRVVACPSCESDVTVAERAMNARCPSCGEGLHLQDAIIVGRSVGPLKTLGNVHVTRKGAVRGSVDCEHLLVEGKLAGDITVKETAAIRKKAKVKANITANRVSIEKGATFSGELRIGKMRVETVQETKSELSTGNPIEPASEGESPVTEILDTDQMKFARRPWIIHIEPKYQQAII